MTDDDWADLMAADGPAPDGEAEDEGDIPF